MHEVLVKRLGDLSLSRKSVVRLTDRPDMATDVYLRLKTTITISNEGSCAYVELLTWQNWVGEMLLTDKLLHKIQFAFLVFCLIM